nr:hypothetical protein Iba_chr05dCG11130 [Ipomoea batatas]
MPHGRGSADDVLRCRLAEEGGGRGRTIGQFRCSADSARVLLPEAGEGRTAAAGVRHRRWKAGGDGDRGCYVLADCFTLPPAICFVDAPSSTALTKKKGRCWSQEWRPPLLAAAGTGMPHGRGSADDVRRCRLAEEGGGRGRTIGQFRCSADSARVLLPEAGEGRTAAAGVRHRRWKAGGDGDRGCYVLADCFTLPPAICFVDAVAGYQARMECTEEIMKAAMTPLSLKDLSTLNIGQTRRVKKEARATKKKIPKLPKVKMEPPPTSLSSTTPQPNTPREQTHTSAENQHYSPPVLSPSNSIFNESVAPSAKDPTPAQSSSLSAAPSRFTKVTDWKTMQSFQYELHLEQETFLEQREARHYELLEEMSMQIKFLREELTRKLESCLTKRLTV